MNQLTIQPNLPSNLQSVPIVDLRTRLPVNPKYTWEKLKGKRDLSALSTIVLHHDALSKSRTAGLSDEQLAKNIATSHINSTKNIPGGDAGAPYHIWIRSGRVYVLNNVTDFVYGVASNNSNTVHICVSGDYANYDALTDQDRLALYAAVHLARANMPKYTTLKSHRELSATACPGYDMTKVRSDLAEIDLSASLNNGLNDQLAKAFQTSVRISDLYKTASNPGQWQEAAIKKLARVNEFMVSQGLI